MISQSVKEHIPTAEAINEKPSSALHWRKSSTAEDKVSIETNVYNNLLL